MKSQNKKFIKEENDVKDRVDRGISKFGKFIKGKKKQFRNSSKGDSNIRKGKMFNDVSDYMKNPAITDAFAKLPYSFIVGSRIPGLNQPNTFVTNLEFTVLSSYIIDWVASDTSVSDTDDANYQTIIDQVKTIIYTEMRRANSGSTNNIEPIDVIISNLIATIDILCNAVYFATFFKIVNTFSWKNRNIPKSIFEVRGVDYDDFVLNLANYRGRFDVLVAKAKTIRTLSNFPLVKVAMAEYANIFKDQDTDTGREQLLIPVKAFHHIYDSVGTTAHPGGMVRLLQFSDLGLPLSNNYTVFTAGVTGQAANDYLFKFSVLLNILEKQINALVNDADFNLIQADIEKAFGEQSGYYEVDGISDSSSPMQITYSEEFLQMYHNANLLPAPEPVNSSEQVIIATGLKKRIAFGRYVNTVYQIPDNGDNPSFTRVGVETHVYQDPNIDHSKYALWCENSPEGSVYLGGLVDTDLNDPSPEQNVIMTRFKHLFELKLNDDIPEDFRATGISGDSRYMRTKGSGCFMIFNWQNVTIRYFSNGASPELYSSPTPVQLYRLADSDYLYMTRQFAINHRPFMLATSMELSSTSPTVWEPLFELNNLRFFTPGELSNINLACFLSLWNLPARSTI